MVAIDHSTVGLKYRRNLILGVISILLWRDAICTSEMSIKLETDKGFQKRRTLKEETTLCSKFTMEYESIYYCWLVDPCVEDVAEAPHFLASKPCGADASTCEPLPSEYEHCRDWHQPNGVQSCTDYGPISSCCKYRTCNEGQICVDL